MSVVSGNGNDATDRNTTDSKATDSKATDRVAAEGAERSEKLNVEAAVRARYSDASRAAEPSLCCPVDYDSRYLEVLPQELIDRDYGCGNPSRYVREGDVVLDLGSGGGKICYIASQIVGPEGHVYGVDMNDDMLQLARTHQAQIGEAIGWQNTSFLKGRIQDLSLDVEAFNAYLDANPVRSAEDWQAAEAEARRLRDESPLIAADSIDVVISNCVLNLVAVEDRRRMFAEIFRVLKRGGRAAISDIVCDEPPPEHLRNDPELWSGCISGAFEEREMLAAFEEAGFHGMEITERQSEPWAVVEGIEFRSVTVQAYKGKDGPCLDCNQAVIYRGPWKQVVDDDGHILRRGERTAVCDKTYRLYQQPPYEGHFFAVPSATPVPLEQAVEFDCRRNAIREPAETKRGQLPLTQIPGDDCCGSSGCC